MQEWPSSALGDEKHVVFGCPALASLRTTYQHPFVCAPTMRQFMWQRDTVGGAKFIILAWKQCMQLALPLRARHLISPEVAGKDVI